MTTPAGLRIVPAGLDCAPALHRLYARASDYFAQLGSQPPSLHETTTEVATALTDPARQLWVVPDPAVPGELLAMVDCKLDYPHGGDAVINLLLVREDLRGRGLGQQILVALEEALAGHCLYATVLGVQPHVHHFWQRRGYAAATDGSPVLTWYAKVLGERPLAG